MRRSSLRRSNPPFGSGSARNRLIRAVGCVPMTSSDRPVSLPTISPLRGLVEVTRLLRAREDLPALLDAVARTIGESLGYRTVAVNLYRPQWDDFEVTTVYGNEEAQERCCSATRGPATTGRCSSRSASSVAAPTSCRAARSTGTRSARATCRREGGRAIPTPGIPRTRSSSRCATSGASCSGSSRWTSRSAAAGRRTTSSTCSSRSSTMRALAVEAVARGGGVGAAPARARGAARRLVAHHRGAVELRDPAPGVHRHPRRSRLPQRLRGARRPGDRRGRAAGGGRLAARGDAAAREP